MRNGERVHGDVADLEARAGAENATLKLHLKLEFDCLLRESIAVKWNFQFRAEAHQSLNVVRVLMGDQDAGQTFRCASNGGEALANLAATEAGINEYARFRRFQIGAVTAGTTAKDR